MHRRNAGSAPCCAWRTPLRSRGTRQHRARKWHACVRRLWPSTQRRAGRYRRIPDPVRCSVPWVLGWPPEDKPSRIAGMPQRLRCMPAGMQLRFGQASRLPKASVIRHSNLGPTAAANSQTAAPCAVGTRRAFGDSAQAGAARVHAFEHRLLNPAHQERASEQFAHHRAHGLCIALGVRRRGQGGFSVCLQYRRQPAPFGGRGGLRRTRACVRQGRDDPRRTRQGGLEVDTRTITPEDVRALEDGG